MMSLAQVDPSLTGVGRACNPFTVVFSSKNSKYRRCKMCSANQQAYPLPKSMRTVFGLPAFFCVDKSWLSMLRSIINFRRCWMSVR